MVYNPTHTRVRTRGQRMRRCERRDMKRLFLATYAQCATIRTACRVLQVSRSTFYAWMASDPLFNHKYELLTSVHYGPPFIPDGQEKLEMTAYLQRRKAGKRLIRYYAEYKKKRVA